MRYRQHARHAATAPFLSALALLGCAWFGPQPSLVREELMPIITAYARHHVGEVPQTHRRVASSAACPCCCLLKASVAKAGAVSAKPPCIPHLHVTPSSGAAGKCYHRGCLPGHMAITLSTSAPPSVWRPPRGAVWCGAGVGSFILVATMVVLHCDPGDKVREGVLCYFLPFFCPGQLMWVGYARACAWC